MANDQLVDRFRAFADQNPPEPQAAPTLGDRFRDFAVRQQEADVAAYERGESLRDDLVRRMQEAKVYPSATSAATSAADKQIRRAEDGNWDLPSMTTLSDSGFANVAKEAGTLLNQKVGARLSPGGGLIEGNRAEYDQIQNIFHKFQQDNNLSDEEVQSTWMDFVNRHRQWEPDEDLRVQSDGSLELNPTGTWILDTEEAERRINASGASPTIKRSVIQNLPKIQQEVAENKARAYEAFAASNDSFRAKLFDVMNMGILQGLETGMGGRPQFRRGENLVQDVRDFETNVIDREPRIKKAVMGIQHDLGYQGLGKLAQQGLGTAGLLGSEAAVRKAAEMGQEMAESAGGAPDLGLAGSVLKEAPSVGAQILFTRGIGAGVGAVAPRAAGVAGAGAAYLSAGLQSAALTMPDIYQQEIEKGTPEDEAMRIARDKSVKSGVNTALVPMLFGAGRGGGVESVAAGKSIADATIGDVIAIYGRDGLRKALASPQFRKALGEIGLDIAGEFGEEGIDQINQAFLTADPDTNLSDVWEQGVEAAQVGGALGGATGAGRSLVARSESSKLIDQAQADGASAAAEAAAEIEVPVSPEGETPAATETPAAEIEVPVREPEASTEGQPVEGVPAQEPTAPEPTVEAPLPEQAQPTQAPSPQEPTGPLPEGTAPPETGAAEGGLTAGGDVATIGQDDRATVEGGVTGSREGARPGQPQPQGAEVARPPQEAAQGPAEGVGGLATGERVAPTGQGEVLGELGVAGRGDGRAGGSTGSTTVGDVAPAVAGPEGRAFREQVRKEAEDAGKAHWREILSSGQGAVPYRSGGGQYIVTRSSKPGVMFQITRTNAKGEPLGDEEIRTKEDYQRVLNDPEYLDAATEAVRPDIAQAVQGTMAIPEFDKPYIYNYRLKYRDVGPGTAPEGFVSAEGRNVSYDRPLSAQELYDFEIEPVGATEVSPTTPTPQTNEVRQEQGQQVRPQEGQQEVRPEGLQGREDEVRPQGQEVAPETPAPPATGETGAQPTTPQTDATQEGQVQQDDQQQRVETREGGPQQEAGGRDRAVEGGQVAAGTGAEVRVTLANADKLSDVDLMSAAEAVLNRRKTFAEKNPEFGPYKEDAAAKRFRKDPSRVNALKLVYDSLKASVEMGQPAELSIISKNAEKEGIMDDFGIKGDAVFQTEYRRIKRSLPEGTVALFKLGDFYEAVGDDALLVAEKTGLPVTTRSGNKVVSIPVESTSSHIKTLNEGGYQVALSDIRQDIGQTTPQTGETDKIATMGTPATAPAAEPRAEVPTAPEGEPIGINRENLNLRLRRYGLPEMTPNKMGSDKKFFDAAFARMEQDPEAASKLADEFAADAAEKILQGKPEEARQMTLEEEALFVIEANRRNIAVREAQDEYLAARKIGDEQAEAEAWQKMEAASLRFAALAQAIDLAKSATGRALRGFRAQIFEDYSLAGLSRRMEIGANKGKPLTEDQFRKVAAYAETLKQTKDRIDLFALADAYLEDGDTDLANRIYAEAKTLEQLTKDLERAELRAAKKRPPEFTTKMREKLAPKAEQAMQRLRDRGWFGGERTGDQGGGQDVMMAGLDPESAGIIKDMAIVMADKMAGKLLDFADFTVELTRTFGDKARDFAEQIFHASRQTWHETAETFEATPDPDKIAEEIDPTVDLDSKTVWDLARAYVVAGLRGNAVLDAVTEKINEVLPEPVTRDQVAQRFTKYGEVINPPDPKSTQGMLSQLRTVERITLQIRDLEAGLQLYQDFKEGRITAKELAASDLFPKRTGYQRGEMEAKARELQKKKQELTRDLEQKLRNAGIEVPSDEKRLKTALEATKRRMRNEIEELQRALSKRQPRVKVTRGGVTYDAEATQLRAQLEQLRADYNEVFATERTEAQRIKATLAMLDRRIAEEQQMIAEGIAKRPKGEPVSTPEIEAKRQYLADLREKRRALDPSNTPLEQAKASVKRSIERLTKMIASGDVATRRKQPVNPDEELAALLETREALSDEVRELRKSLPETPEKQRLQVQRALEQSERTLAKLEAKLASGDLSIERRGETAASRDPEVIRVRNRIKELNKELARRRREAKPKKDPEQARLDRYLAATEKRIKDLKDRTRRRDISPLRKPTKPLTDPAAKDAALRYEMTKRAYSQMVLDEMWKTYSFRQKVLRNTGDVVARMSRTLMTVVDFSMVAMQAGLVTLAHPRLVAQNIGKAFAFTEKNYTKAETEVENDPLYGPALEAKLSITTARMSMDITRMEEEHRSRLARILPFGIGKAVVASERVYVAYLNALRMAMFRQAYHILEPQGGATTENLKEVANHINNLTGRGSLTFKVGEYKADLEQSAKFLSDVFFSAKYWSSRFRILANLAWRPLDIASFGLVRKMVYTKEQQMAQKVITQDYAQLLAGKLLLHAFLNIARTFLPGGDDDEPLFDISYDLRSSDFEKIKWRNGTRTDISSGMTPNIVFLTRFITGKKKTINGDIIEIGRGFNSFENLGTNMARSKIAPVPGALWNLRTGRDYIGKPVYWEKELVGMYIPLSVRDVYENFRQMGIPKATALSALALFGYTSNTYGPGVEDTDAVEDLNQKVIFPALNGPLFFFDKEFRPNRYEIEPEAGMTRDRR